MSGAGLSQLSAVSFTQTGSDLTLCVPGAGTVATGTVDEGTGAFTLAFDPSFASSFYEFGVCSLEWGGTFALDGGSLTGDEVSSLGCGIPELPSCCFPAEADPITGSRTSPTVTCCGNGVIEGGEVCDPVPAIGQDCCAGDCTFEPAGHFCGATDQCHLKECNALGECEALPPSDCGPCYQCDPADGCLADIRSDCRVGGSGARLRAVGQGMATTFAWRWREGAGVETALGDLGNPTVDTDYELCIFTRDLVASGFARLRAELDAGATCGQGPCWESKANGFRYRDRAGSAAGVRKSVLTAKSNRRSSLKAAGLATNLSPPLANEVTVQMSARDGAPSRCWSTTFTAPQINQPGRYSATLP